MTEKTAKAILEELAMLRAEVALQTEAARETQAILLALVPKQTANEWLRNQGVQMFPKENENGPC